MEIVNKITNAEFIKLSFITFWFCVYNYFIWLAYYEILFQLMLVELLIKLNVQTNYGISIFILHKDL